MTKSAFSFLNKRAQAQFTNRERPIESFEKSLQTLNQSMLSRIENKTTRVLHFYGIGGIGKSRLIAKFDSLIETVSPNARSAIVDFDDVSVRESHRALLRLRHLLKSKGLLSFKTFDFAYAIYFSKRNPDIKLQSDSLPYLEEAGILGDVIGAIDGFGLVSAAKGLLEQSQKYARKLALNPDARTALAALKTMSERDIADALPEFFAFDLNQAQKIDEPLILFFDTYEALWENHTNDAGWFQRDAWVRKLVDALRGTLIVIAGREKLRWVEYDNRWAQVVENHRLSRLSKADVKAFLASAGVIDSELVDEIVDVANGHPYYLDLCLDLLAQAGVKHITDWPDTRRELYERFAKSLSSGELALLKRLAPLATYDLTYCRAVARQFHISMNDDEVLAHRRFSFVKVQADGFTIHDLMRKSLLSQTDPEIVEEIRAFAFRHFNARLNDVDADSPDTAITLPLQECSRQLRYLEDKSVALDWMSGSARSAFELLQRRASAGPILECLGFVGKVLPVDEWPSEMWTLYADVTHLVGRYETSVEMLEAQLASKGPFGALSPTDKFATIRMHHHSMMYSPAQEVWSQVETLLPEFEPTQDSKAYAEALFLLGGNLGCAIGDLELAIPWLLKALRASYRNDDITLRLRIYRKCSDLYRIAGDLKGSARVLRRASAILERTQLRRYGNYIDCTLVDQLRLMKEREEAMRILKSARENIADANLEGWLGHTYLAEAALSIDANAFEIAKAYLKVAAKYYSRTRHLWGTLQVEMLSAMVQEYEADTAVRAPGLRSSLVGRLRQAGLKRDALNYDSFVPTNDALVPAIAFL